MIDHLDIKDRKILYELDINSRQSFSQIGRKVGLSKHMVSYRINRLIEKGIIKNFYAFIDSYKLGYTVYRIYLVFQYATPEIKKEIINYFVDNNSTWVVASVKGRYDLSVVLWVKNVNQFYDFWEKTLEEYGNYFAEKIFSVYVQSYAYRQSYLIIDEHKKLDRISYEITGGKKRVELDGFDFQLLHEISLNARVPTTELAEKFNVSAKTLSTKLKKLIKLGIIESFRVTIDISKVGLQFFKVDIYLRDHKQRNAIMDYVKHNPYLVFIAKSVGVSDLELEFYLEHSDKIHKIMDDIMIKFPNAVRNYKYFSVQKTHKKSYMPEE